MAVAWTYRRESGLTGQARFRELVQLVRADELGADDLVKADWEDVWRPAATVVGLFKMAGRADVLAKWEAEKLAAEQAAVRQEAAQLEAGSVDVRENAVDGSLSVATAEDLNLLLGLQPATAPREALSVLTPAAQGIESREGGGEAAAFNSIDGGLVTGAASGVSLVMQSAIDAAMDEAESRDVSRENAQGPSFWSRVYFPGVGAVALRWGGALLFANLTAIGILSWSELQVQRFPERSVSVAQTEIFPFWGRCSSNQYAFFLTDAIVLAGFGGYLAARYVGRHADDFPSDA